MDFSENMMRWWRRQVPGLTQSVVAKAIGVTPQTVQKWEDIGTPAKILAPPSKYHETLARLFGIDPAELLKYRHMAIRVKEAAQSGDVDVSLLCPKKGDRIQNFKISNGSSGVQVGGDVNGDVGDVTKDGLSEVANRVISMAISIRATDDDWRCFANLLNNKYFKM
jgi:DNA-binding XRE family transcriptional regulator/uncharacterized Zn-binding protein involved in type VI secretion